MHMADTHVELAGSRRPLARNAHRIRDIDPHAHIEATVVLKAPPLPCANNLPVAAFYPAELERRYAAAPDDVQKVEAVLQSYGLKIEGLTPSGRNLKVSGPASAIEAAFKAGLGIYRSPEQGEFRGREGSLFVPAELDGLVETILGLDRRRMAFRRMARAAKAKRAAPGAPLAPADLENRYNFPPGNCAGEFVAIAEFGSPLQSGAFLPPAYFPDDVTKFCTDQRRPVPAVTTVPVGLAPLSPQQVAALPAQVQNEVMDETGEVMMDVEIVAALCPAARISVYYAPWSQDGWVNLLEQVTKDRPVALSVSYGLAEDSPDWTPSALSAIGNALQLAAMAGITVCVSSGDDGSGCNMSDAKAHVEFPGSSPFVLSVGGTMLNPSTTPPSEVVWWQSPGRRTGNGHSGATGGGVSVKFDRPAWQTVNIASVNPGAIDGRVVPDVAALAGPPLYALVMQGQPAPNGGTSASAPLWASLIARIDAALPAAKKQRFLPRLLYQNAAQGGGTIGAAGCSDIVSGHNTSTPQPGKGYQAVAGYDAVTGWGVPNGRALLAAL